MYWGYLINFVKDSIREILQIFLLVFFMVIPSIFDFEGIIKALLIGEHITLENIKYYYLMYAGNLVMGCLLAALVLFRFIRVSNKSTIFNSGNLYHDKPYMWYWFSSKILGYKKCNLVLVPIYIQYKLIINDTFEEYPFNEADFPTKKCHVDVRSELTRQAPPLNEINLIIQDTYPITDDQIPVEKKANNAILIMRDREYIGERIHCEELINIVVEEVRRLNDNITLNIFSTTNPKNTYEIVKKAICIGNRGNIGSVNVFQQDNKGIRAFAPKSHKVI